MEERLRKVERDNDRLWNEYKINQVKTSQFEVAVEAISKEITAIKDAEVEKAVERQKMMNSLDNVHKGIKHLDEKFSVHIIDEMKVYGSLRKVIIVMGVMLIALIVDSQAGTHIISSTWKWAFKAIAGV